MVLDRMVLLGQTAARLVALIGLISGTSLLPGCGGQSTEDRDAGVHEDAGVTNSGPDGGADAGVPDSGISGWCTDSALDTICLVESGFIHALTTLSDGGSRVTLAGGIGNVGVSLRFDLGENGTTASAFTFTERECVGALCPTRCEYAAAPLVQAGSFGSRIEGTFAVPSISASVSPDGGCPPRDFTSRFGFQR